MFYYIIFSILRGGGGGGGDGDDIKGGGGGRGRRWGWSTRFDIPFRIMIKWKFLPVYFVDVNPFMPIYAEGPIKGTLASSADTDKTP